MQDYITVTAMVLKQTPVGEYDRRICLLTKEKGKISAFARGARKPSGKLAAATNPLSFGEFKLYPGRDSYTVIEANISQYFEELRTDYEGACYGMYFAEVADYYGRENNDEKMLLKLLYQSLRALTHPDFDRKLVRAVFECKAIMVNGEYPGLPEKREYLEGTKYAMAYIENATVEKVFNFRLSEEVLAEVLEVSKNLKDRFMNHPFKSLEVLKTLG